MSRNTFLVLLTATFSFSILVQVRAQETKTSPAITEKPQQQKTGSPLSQLDWLIGSWQDNNEEATITINCTRLGKNGFLRREFKVKAESQTELNVMQIIGYEPNENVIRSWSFDSDGGFGNGIWQKKGDDWIVKTSFELASGEFASSINVITKIDNNTFRWKSVNRIVAGTLQPSIPEVSVTRKQITQPPVEQEQSSNHRK